MLLRTVNVRNPNVRYSDNSEIRTFGIRTTPKSERSIVLLIDIRISDFGHTKLDRFIYKGGHKNYFLYLKRSSLMACPKTERNVRFSALFGRSK